MDRGHVRNKFSRNFTDVLPDVRKQSANSNGGDKGAPTVLLSRADGPTGHHTRLTKQNKGFRFWHSASSTVPAVTFHCATGHYGRVPRAAGLQQGRLSSVCWPGEAGRGTEQRAAFINDT